MCLLISSCFLEDLFCQRSFQENFLSVPVFGLIVSYIGLSLTCAINIKISYFITFSGVMIR